MATSTIIPENLDPARIPRHVAVIMDGNGRWAKHRGKPRIFGHHSAVEAVRETTEACAELGVDYLTLYAFSTENWNRPKLEVGALMQLLVHTIKAEMDTLQKNNIRLHAIGQLDQLPKATGRALQQGIDDTAGNTGTTLVLALNYSGKWDLTQAARQLAARVRAGQLEPGAVTEEELDRGLSTFGMPEPELIIRTSGERRLSNFYLWQAAYTEFYFSDIFWPDFRKADLHAAVYDFQHRERRFGKTSEQIQPTDQPH